MNVLKKTISKEISKKTVLFIEFEGKNYERTQAYVNCFVMGKQYKLRNVWWEELSNPTKYFDLDDNEHFRYSRKLIENKSKLHKELEKEYKKL